ncbi:hypothetical protein CIHG_07150 [Coccidioides immitis H538.4]|uniref:Uncharacterized protein n=1 Tax=Coccidioides immitis H538.4 TaxID=396776 RepID=A0A0J8RXB0_COCIT|nr:hypothetical protein CIHG_07150 [Coccidioides immitis H538.4]
MSNENSNFRPPMPPPQVPHAHHPELLKREMARAHVNGLPNANQSIPLDEVNAQFKKLNLDPVLVRGAAQEKLDRNLFLQKDNSFTDEEDSCDEDEDEDEDEGREPYQGWSLYRAKPTVLGQEPDWSRVTKSRMNLTQEDLRKLVKGQKKGSVAKTYSSLGRLKRKQIDDLIEELRRKDGRFNWNVIYIQAINKETGRRGFTAMLVTTTINLVLEKTLKPGVSLSPRNSQKKSPRFKNDPASNVKGNVRGQPRPRVSFHYDASQPHPISGGAGSARPQATHPPTLPSYAGTGPGHGAQADPRPQPLQQQPLPPFPQPQQVHPQAQPQPQPNLQPPPPPPPPPPSHHPPPQHSERLSVPKGAFPPMHPTRQGNIPPGVQVVNGPPRQSHPHIPPVPPIHSVPDHQSLPRSLKQETPVQVKQMHEAPEIVHVGKKITPKNIYAVDQWLEDSSNGDNESELFEHVDDSSETDDSFIADDFESKNYRTGGSQHASRESNEPTSGYRRHRRPGSKYLASREARDSQYSRGEVDIIPATGMHRGPLIRSASVSYSSRPSLKLIHGGRSAQTSISSRDKSPFRYTSLTNDILIQREWEREEMERQKEIDYIWRKRLQLKEDDLKRREWDVKRREMRMERAGRAERRSSVVDSYDDQDRGRFRSKFEAPRRRGSMYHGAERPLFR